MGNLLTLKQVAKALNVSEQRVYQMDSELQPVFVRRGSKMKSRLYKPDVIAKAVAARAEASAAPAFVRRLPDQHWQSLCDEGLVALTQESAAEIAWKACHFCGDDTGRRNALVRLDGGRVHSPWNTVAACGECKRWMAELDGNEFLARVRTIKTLAG